LRRGLLVSVLLTLLVCFGAFAAVVVEGWKPLLGLDLRGGLSVVYCPAKTTNVSQCSTKGVSKAKLNEAVNILDDRVQGLGVGQPNIGVQGSDVVVQLPGIKDPRRVEQVLGSTAQLYFRPVLCYAPPYTAPAKKSTASTTTTTRPPKVKANGSTSTTSATGSSTTTTAATTTTTTPAGTSTGGYLYPPACPANSTYTPTLSNESSIQPYPPLAGYKTTPLALDNPSKTVLLKETGTGSGDRVELGPSLAPGSIISNAYAQDLPTAGGWVVEFVLTGSGTTTFNNKIAAPYYDRLVADDLDGTVVSAPVIEARSFAGQGEISGNFTSASANTLAIELKYGALPVRLVRLTSQVVSASLGSASLRAGLLAGLLGLLLVMLYTIFYYRALGIVVVLGLVSTGALLYAIISFLGYKSGLTLDLSGITGLIVSVGITVDSYVVYFERLKDEVRAGRSIRSSVDRGFRSAYRTILSADAVSFIGAAVLWILSIGAVRGFAFMLGLSTLLDVATAYLFTRPLVILLGRNRIFTEARGLGVARGLAAPPAEAL
jgi:preprotein translocase subunit SecD